MYRLCINRDLRKHYFIILVFNLITIINGWKPIIGPPSAFTLTQSHPPVGSASALVQHQSQQLKQNVLQNDVGSSASDSLGERSSSFALINTDHHGSSGVGFIDGNGGDDDTSSEYKEIDTNSKLFPDTSFDEDACSVNKYAFDHIGTVTYKNAKIPKLEQFTICNWMRFTNHSGDHTIFTYSVKNEPREIQLWIANSKGSSYISMAVHGQSLFRLNYPMKMRKWHHACSSWNGKTGEWQLWVKGERVGRGFHNRLVNHKIPSGGIAYSGGQSITGPTADGLHFELTLLQIYKVALTAGKAHRDHKHHHVHHFDHNGPVTSTARPTVPPPTPMIVMNALLANGQIPTRVRLNLAMPPPNPDQQQQQPSVPGIPSQVIGGLLPGSSQSQVTINTNFVSGQFSPASRLISQQLVTSRGIPILPNQILPQQQILGTPPLTYSSVSHSLINPANVQYIDTNDAPSSPTTRFLFKSDSLIDEKSINKREAVDVKKSEKNIQSQTFGKKLSKRGLVELNDGVVIDDTLLAHGYQFEGLAQFGLPDFKKTLQVHMSIEDEIKEHDKEPAEEEVKAVMNLCSACDEEPFKGAIVFAWKNAIVTQENTLKGRSVGGCGYF